MALLACPTTPLRVAMLAPISWRVPPRHYGPWEQFVSLLTEGLVDRGVDVTLFATADSLTRGRLVGTAPTGYSEDPGLDPKVWGALHISAVFERANEFDLIHNSFDFLLLTYSALVDTPVVTTIHGFSSERILPVFEKYNDRSYYVAISDADPQREVGLRRHDPPRHRHERVRGAVERRRLPAVLRQNPPREGDRRGHRRGAQAGMPLTIAGIVQDMTTSSNSWPPGWTESG
jgi:hypothetical protein